MEETKKKKSAFSSINNSTKALIAVMCVIAVILVYFVFLPWVGLGADRQLNIIGTGNTLDYEFDAGAAFHSNDSRFFYFVTREGVRYIASNGNIAWQSGFNMHSPMVYSRGDFVAVGERAGGQTVYVFNATGELYRVTLEDTIRAFWVNETGILSVIVQTAGGGYGVFAFNQNLNTAEDPLFGWTMFYDLFIPYRAEVSPDGRYIAIAVFNFEYGVYTYVHFRYMNRRDAWGTDFGLFAEQEFPGEIVTAMQFMNNNRLIIGTPSRIHCYQLGPGHRISELLWSIPLANELTHIAFHNGTHFSVAKGQRLLRSPYEYDPMGTIRIYELRGNSYFETGSFELGRRVTHLRMGQNSVIVGGDRSFHAMDFRGSLLWEHTTLFDTRDVLFLENTNTMLIAGSTRAEVFERRRLRDNEHVFPVLY
ncbi:MAG: DUF5711 family protein [Defluviitaleaceae bacterium]|nr:DUF5711 family protein [Defluviitaleaceae bacterium]